VAHQLIRFDIPVMIAVALACLPICFTGGVISRWEGGVLFAYYLAYTLYLILAATHHDALPVFSATMLYFALPLTALTLVVLALQRRHRGIYGLDWRVAVWRSGSLGPRIHVKPQLCFKQ
jgi:cation:H+ antiporter